MGCLLLSFDLCPSEMYLVLLLYEETLPVYEFVLVGTTEQERVLLASTQHVRNYHFAQQEVAVHCVTHHSSHLRIAELDEGVSF